MKEQYVCAFRGRRDSYQVPLALAETGQLDEFITDIYAGPGLRGAARFVPASVRAKLESRFQPGIPSDRVHCLWGTTALEHFRHRLGYARMSTFDKLDRRFSWAAARRAEQTRSHLFLYSSYAWEAFTSRYTHTPHKVLFQYHPHPALERRLLVEDAALYPNMGEMSPGAHEVSEAQGQREYDAWKHADLIFCASTFTKRSVLEVGADEKKCCVVPYGMVVSPFLESHPPDGAFKVLFVGSGWQRKGLHHLLLAWQRASLPESSKLSLVCRVIDREIVNLAATVPRVELLRGVKGMELNRFYSTSSLFAMPSLVEGFGQVYLEAMAHGCPVLGTSNTGLPDLGNEANGIFLVTPGNIEELTAQLERLSRLLPPARDIRRAAHACAGRFTWPAFRATLCQKLGNFFLP